jgi:hypothetical protein
MQKYTIVYSEVIRRGSMHTTIIKMERVETNDIAKFIDGPPYNNNVAYIFVGWPLEEGENVS